MLNVNVDSWTYGISNQRGGGSPTFDYTNMMVSNITGNSASGGFYLAGGLNIDASFDNITIRDFAGSATTAMNLFQLIFSLSFVTFAFQR